MCVCVYACVCVIFTLICCMAGNNVAVDVCVQANPCVYGACTDGGDGTTYTCACNAGWQGTDCDQLSKSGDYVFHVSFVCLISVCCCYY